MGDPFSVRLRQRTWSSHEDTRGAGFITELMDGTRGIDDYTALVAQHLQIYRAIEETGAALESDPLVGPFLDPALDRVARLRADLRTLGVDPDDAELAVLAPLPATADYTARVRASADQPVAFLAHHFTRYLGDLSGGQVIGTHLRRRFGWQEDGVRFYSFPAIASPKRYKDQYRARLDAVAQEWSPEQDALMIDEVLAAYEHNTEVFVALEEARVPA